MVRRCALVGLGTDGRQSPVLVVEPRTFPASDLEATNLAAAIRAHAASNPGSLRVSAVVFQKSLPVDARHAAKVHRLALGRHWQARGRATDGDRDAKERWS